MFSNNLDKILVGCSLALVPIVLHLAAVELEELGVLADDVVPDVGSHQHGAGERDRGVEKVLILAERRENMSVDTVNSKF